MNSLKVRRIYVKCNSIFAKLWLCSIIMFMPKGTLIMLCIMYKLATIMYIRTLI